MEFFLFLLGGMALGLIPAAFAQRKGRNFFVWWVYGSLIFIVAMPHAFFLRIDPDAMDMRAVAKGAMKKCLNCAELIRSDAKVCRFCGYDFRGANLAISRSQPHGPRHFKTGPTSQSDSIRTVAGAGSKATNSSYEVTREDRWEILVKYDPDIQLALKELAEFGKPAIDELRKAYTTVNDPSKLKHIVEIIKKDHARTDSLEKENNREYHDEEEKIDNLRNDERELEKFLRSSNLYLERRQKWIDIIDLSTNKKLCTVYDEESLFDYLKKRFA